MAADTYRHPDQNVGGTAVEPVRARTGIEGLDVILGGGLPRGYLYVVEGYPGTGKTTLALQFLLAGREHNEPCLLITTSETRDDLTVAARGLGWSLAGIEILELSLTAPLARPEQRQTMFRPSQIVFDEVMDIVQAEIERVQPTRMVFDSLSMLRYMADELFTYRQHVVSLKNRLADLGCTALITDEIVVPQDLHLRTLAHGVVQLLLETTPFGNERRQVVIVKMRGMPFRSGRHDMRIETGGIRVFPRSIIEPNHVDHTGETESTDIATLDVLLGGGLDRSATTLFVGAAGTGKSSVTTQCVAAALQRGQRAVVYLFDERPPMWLYRANQFGFDLSLQVRDGNLAVQQIDPAEMTPGQFAYELQCAVTQYRVQTIIIDSLTGYVNAMPDERYLVVHLHAVLNWLCQHGITTLLVLDQMSVFESNSRLPLDLISLIDTVVLFRFFERQGAIHRALSVVKRRGGPHESTIRELILGPNGIAVGEPLRQFRGVLSGLPVYEGGGPHEQPR